MLGWAARNSNLQAYKVRSFNSPEPDIWTCLNRWVIPDMISTPFLPQEPCGQDDHFELPHGKPLIWTFVFWPWEPIIYSNKLPWPGHMQHMDWHEIEPRTRGVSSKAGSSSNCAMSRLICKTAVACCCPCCCHTVHGSSLLSWHSREPGDLEMLKICYAENTLAMPCNGNVEQRSPANSTTCWGTTDQCHEFLQ